MPGGAQWLCGAATSHRPARDDLEHNVLHSLDVTLRPTSSLRDLDRFPWGLCV
jgi:hypothetical protein